MIILFCLFIPTAEVFAQYSFDILNADKGLPQNSVLSVLQTRDGYLWLSTSDGLVRYDGVKCKIFNKTNAPGINSNRFTQLYEALDGTLWAGTEDGGLVRLKNGVFESLTTEQGLPNNQVRWIYGDANNRLLIETSGGVRWFDGEHFSEVAEQAKFGNPKIYLAPSGILWLIGTDKLYRSINGETEEFALPAALKLVPSASPFEDSRGNLWFISEQGVVRFENGAFTIFSAAENIAPEIIKNIRLMTEDSDGAMWFAAQNKLLSYQNGVFTVLENFPDAQSRALFEDREGTLWVGTAANGLIKVSRQSIETFSAAQGLANKNVYPILQTRNGDLYIGSQPGLTHISGGKARLVPMARETGRDLADEKLVSSADGASKVEVTALAETSDGTLWIGALNGLAVLKDGKLTDYSTLITFKDELGFTKRGAVWTILEDDSGALWLGTEHGLFRRQNREIRRFSTADGLPDKNVRIVFQRRDGTILAGTNNGLAQFDGSRFSLVGLANKQVRAIYEDAEEVLWIGTYDGGLSRLKDARLVTVTTENGLFSGGAFQILEADDRFWLSSNQGIYTVRKQELNDFADGRLPAVTSVSYSVADGMLNRECNGGRQPAGIKAADGRLWFPTQDGAAIVNPRAISFNRIAPPVVVESVKIDNAEIPPKAELSLSPGQNNLEIAYTGLSFIKPEQVRFRYKMDGLNDDWVDAGTRRTAYFSFLPPGDYVFTVTAANSDGVWNSLGASLKIRVLPPFYRTWWFSLLAVGAVGGLVFMLFRSRVNRLIRARRAQEEFSRKLLESQERERQRIAAELHDSIGQSLLIIKNRAFLALSDLDEREAVREQLLELTDSADGAIEECREIAYNLRPFQIEHFGLTKTLEAIFRSISEVSDIETSVETALLDDLFSSEAQTNIYRIVQESVNNIIKHSGATRAILQITRAGGEIVILISDNGVGFDKNKPKADNKRGGFGLIGSAERVRMLGGTYEIDSQVGGGTRIKIVVPLNQINEREK